MIPQLYGPFSALIIGASNAGKSTLVRQIITERKTLISPPPQSVLFAYSTYQKELTELANDIILHEGMPELETIQSLPKPALVILDDLLGEVTRDKEKVQLLHDIYQKYSHHCNFNVKNQYFQ
jgi:ribosome biogenesis GTPase A